MLGRACSPFRAGDMTGCSADRTIWYSIHMQHIRMISRQSQIRGHERLSYQFAKGLTFKVGTHALMRPLRPASISDG
jgi:hypothetical protein